MPTKADKRRVERWKRVWQRRLLLQAWTIEIRYNEDELREGATHAIMAIATPKHRYTNLVIEVYQDFWNEPVDEQERIFAHEVVHAITDHTKDLIFRRVQKKRVTEDEALDANEKLTEHITNIVWRAYH
jgi:hypothetical protein